MICYNNEYSYSRHFLTNWSRHLEQKAYSLDTISHHIPRNPRQYLFSLLQKKMTGVTNKRINDILNDVDTVFIIGYRRIYFNNKMNYSYFG